MSITKEVDALFASFKALAQQVGRAKLDIKRDEELLERFKQELDNEDGTNIPLARAIADEARFAVIEAQAVLDGKKIDDQEKRELIVAKRQLRQLLDDDDDVIDEESEAQQPPRKQNTESLKRAFQVPPPSSPPPYAIDLVNDDYEEAEYVNVKVQDDSDKEKEEEGEEEDEEYSGVNEDGENKSTRGVASVIEFVPGDLVCRLYNNVIKLPPIVRVNGQRVISNRNMVVYAMRIHTTMCSVCANSMDHRRKWTKDALKGHFVKAYIPTKTKIPPEWHFGAYTTKHKTQMYVDATAGLEWAEDATNFSRRTSIDERVKECAKGNHAKIK
jgi:hypothetical protein